MSSQKPLFVKLSMIWIAFSITMHAYAADEISINSTIAHAVKPLKQKYHISGMAVGLIYDGQFYQYYDGIQSKIDKKPITQQTIFELGSVSKIFTATAGAYVQEIGKLSFKDYPSQYWPDLKHSEIDQVNLLQLLTYTSGNLPLQLPEDIKTNTELLSYFKNFKIKYSVGHYRQYSNPSIGLFGYITAKAMHIPFPTLLKTIIFPKFQLKHTYVDVPTKEMTHYALGYNDQDLPVRVNMNPLSSEAYGIKSTLPDLLKFINFNINLNNLSST